MTLTSRQWGIFFLTKSLAVLAIVYISQYGFGLHPCHLCHLERVPYFVAVILAFLLAATNVRPRWVTLLLIGLTLAFAASLVLGVFHWGVENKWWIYASECTGEGLFTPGASTADFLAALKKAPTARCDEPVTFLFGMSMAFYNVLASAVLLIVAGFLTAKRLISRT